MTPDRLDQIRAEAGAHPYLAELLAEFDRLNARMTREDATYVYIVGEQKSGFHHTDEVVPGTVFVDYDADGNPIGVEILGPVKTREPKSHQL